MFTQNVSHSKDSNSREQYHEFPGKVKPTDASYCIAKHKCNTKEFDVGKTINFKPEPDMQ